MTNASDDERDGGADAGRPAQPEGRVTRMQVVEGIARVDDVDDFVATLDAIGTRHGVAIQAFDARYVAGRAHLERAVALANRAFARDDAIARERSVEILLYAAGRRQIDRALEMGVDEGEGPLVIVVDGADEESERAAAEEAATRLVDEARPTLGQFDEDRLRGFFDVGDAELAATDATLPELVCERVALLTVEK